MMMRFAAPTSSLIPNLASRRLEHIAALEGTAHLEQCLFLELADAFAGQVILLANLLERKLLVVGQAEALLENVGLDGLEMLEQLAHLACHGFADQSVDGRVLELVRIRDEIDELATILVRYCTIERQRLIQQIAAHLL